MIYIDAVWLAWSRGKPCGSPFFHSSMIFNAFAPIWLITVDCFFKSLSLMRPFGVGNENVPPQAPVKVNGGGWRSRQIGLVVYDTCWCKRKMFLVPLATFTLATFTPLHLQVSMVRATVFRIFGRSVAQAYTHKPCLCFSCVKIMNSGDNPCPDVEDQPAKVELRIANLL